jgi:tetratricopeptide (TPR) repeat protein
MATSEQPSTSFGGDAQRELFLSYNNGDREMADRFRQALISVNVSTFFDRTDLTPGQPWFDELETALRRVRGVAVLVGREGLGTIQKREMQFALARQAEADKEGRRFPVVPVLLAGSDPDSMSGFLALNTYVDLRRGFENPGALNPLIRAIRPAAQGEGETASSAICPYRGLSAFREEDSALFFGRDAFSRKLLTHVLENSLVVLIGRSGSGKSSIAQAGLLPLLRRQKPPDDTWESIMFSPGSRPFHRLAAQLVPLWSPRARDLTDIATESEKLGERLANGELSLASSIDLALANLTDTSRLLAIVDQFEELFTGVQRDEEPGAFIRQMLAASHDTRLTILLTLRADFYGHALKFRELSEAIEIGLVNVSEMTRQELRQAIEAPATLAGLRFEAGLVERIVDHIDHQPGSLPLLEYALTELWRRRHGNQFTHAAYDGIGGVGGAITHRAETQFEKLTAAQKKVALPALARLVRVSSTSEGGTDTRQIVKLVTLSSDEQNVVRIFAEKDSRLVVTGRDETSGEETVEVAHEALIRSWDRLREWIDKNREFLTWCQRLDLFLAEWQRTLENTGALLSGVYLEEARRWSSQRGQDLNPEQRRYIQVSARASAVSTGWKTAGVVAVALIVVAVLGSWIWTRSDLYQIQLAVSEGRAEPPNPYTPWVDQWPASLVYLGRTPDGLDSVRKLPDKFNGRVTGLARVAVALEKIGDSRTAGATFDEALAVIGQLNGKPFDRDESREIVATALADVQEWPQALSIAGQIENSRVKSETLRKLVSALTSAGNFSQATALIPAIDESFDRGWALDTVVDGMVANGRATEALAIVHTVSDLDSFGGEQARLHALVATGNTDEALAAIAPPTFYAKARVLVWIAEYFAGTGQVDEVPAVLDRLGTALIPNPNNDYYTVRDLARLTRALLKAGRSDQAKLVSARALRAAGSDRFIWSRTNTLIEIAPVLREAGLGNEADAAVADALKEEMVKEVAGRAVESLTRAGRADEAYRFAQQVPESPNKVECLSIAAAALEHAGKFSEAHEAAERARQVADRFVDARAYSQVAAAFARLHDYRQARLAAEKCRLSGERVSSFAAILREYMAERQPELRKGEDFDLLLQAH